MINRDKSKLHSAIQEAFLDSWRYQRSLTLPRPVYENCISNLNSTGANWKLPSDSVKQEFSGTGLCDQLSQVAQDFEVDDFKLDTVLGQGRCKVYLDEYDSHPISLQR